MNLIYTGISFDCIVLSINEYTSLHKHVLDTHRIGLSRRTLVDELNLELLVMKGVSSRTKLTQGGLVRPPIVPATPPDPRKLSPTKDFPCNALRGLDLPLPDTEVGVEFPEGARLVMPDVLLALLIFLNTLVLIILTGSWLCVYEFEYGLS